MQGNRAIIKKILHYLRPYTFFMACSVLAAAVSALLSIGGYVVFFSSLLAVTEKLGFPGAAAENRVQAWREREELLSAAGLPAPEWHLIGSLQVNKVKYVVGKVALIQSADSEKLIREIGRIADARGIRQDILIEINSGREPDKGGALPEEAEALAEFARSVPGVRPV